ncbi:DUF799 domain-containing protein [Halopseudomonas salegens]|uniref:Lipoprotein n=1 Tax=Halopseudomonas salegens TaxID=1434072 RepID=A0A1H2FNW2_9GAMM|nr:DUF799 domain-containing protein [Halopseudomonas salegens]SDU08658.1 hypothetical protein SAMN05216210_1676 [Halopseudomonas salegens]
MKQWIGLLALGASMLLSGCATPNAYDYSAFQASKPRSILVLPPVNNSLDPKAGYSLLTQVSYPLAESGYYVFPVAVVQQMFHDNGLHTAEDIHNLPLNRLNDVFAADAVLYITIKQYGTSYMVISSDTRVTAEASLVDSRSGQLLWKGQATASSTEQNGNSGGLIGMLVQAVVDQVINTISERGHQIAGITSVRLLSSHAPNGILPGPRARQNQRQ